MYTEPKYVDSADTCFFCDCTPLHECKVLDCTFHASILCQSEICRSVPIWAANLAAAAAFAVVVAVDDATDNTRPGVLMCRKWYTVPPQYPQNADGQPRNDQEF